MACITKECINDYLDKLEDSITEYMHAPITQRSTEIVDSMVECWERVKGLSDAMEGKFEFTDEDAKAWLDGMENVDGTIGAHWTVEETDPLRPMDVSNLCWNVAMNMMYSDYSDVANKYGGGAVRFYADMAKAFLYDPDAPDHKKKLGAYYHAVLNK